MDTTDPDITFNAAGICRYCVAYESAIASANTTKANREGQLSEKIASMKAHGVGKKYDAVIGVSGGVDSTYVALLCKRFGLRCLAVHVDNGWNSGTAVNNIEQAVSRLGFDLHTEVLDWDEFRDLQLSFLKASTPDSEIPSDHAIAATVIKMAWRLNTFSVFGMNRVNEFILPAAWSQGHQDWRYIRSVQKQFGTRSLRTFPHLSEIDLIRYRLWAPRRALNILDYVEYNREAAIHALEMELGWKNYGGKHYESVYTRFFQGYILPRKFGFDKRRAHYSNMICAGHMLREDALRALEGPPYPSEALEQEDRAFAIKKLGMSEADFQEIMATPPRRYEDYPTLFKSRPYLALRAFSRRVRSLRPSGKL
jgi:N-acetyl sugar amidotransferase